MIKKMRDCRFPKEIMICAIGTSLIGCAPPVDEELISYFGAPEENMVHARNAVDVCLKTPLRLREPVFRNAGYVDAMFEEADRDINDIRGTILIHDESDVVVHLGEDGGLSGCIVGLKGMSPQQSYDLALPWVAYFSGVSNADRGQGLTPNAIQVWQGTRHGSPYIMAYKTWDVLEEPGAAVRLSR